MTAQRSAVDAHLAVACERLSEALAALEVEQKISIDMFRDAMHSHCTAVLAAVWQARWELPGICGDDIEPKEPGNED